MPTLTLVSHHLCPYVQRAAIALLEKGVPFERLNIDLANKPDWFKAISPLGKVPLLKVGEEAVLFESSVICEYLEDTQAPSLHPADPLKKAQHRAWMEFGSSILGDVWGFETGKDKDTVTQKAQSIKAKFETIENVLGSGPYFAGPNISLVDAVFAPIFRYFDTFDAIADFGIFAGTPKVRAWRKALAERPSVKKAVEADYSDRLRAFLKQHDSYLHKIASGVEKFTA